MFRGDKPLHWFIFLIVDSANPIAIYKNQGIQSKFQLIFYGIPRKCND